MYEPKYGNERALDIRQGRKGLPTIKITVEFIENGKRVQAVLGIRRMVNHHKQTGQRFIRLLGRKITVTPVVGRGYVSDSVICNPTEVYALRKAVDRV